MTDAPLQPSPFKLLGIAEVRATLEVLTGLHIGAGKDTIEIGGIDGAVIKDAATREPYVPGSSLKGKLRSIAEWAFEGKLRQDGLPWGAKTSGQPPLQPDDPVIRLFGAAAESNAAWKGGPTRVIVRDAFLQDAWRQEQLERGTPLTELKSEVVMNRLTGKAAGAGPRKIERVPRGAKFDVTILCRLYDTEDGGHRDLECLNWLLALLELLERDALGGSGSRGYGSVALSSVTVTTSGKVQLAGTGSIETLPNFDPETPPSLLSIVVPPPATTNAA